MGAWPNAVCPLGTHGSCRRSQGQAAGSSGLIAGQVVPGPNSGLEAPLPCPGTRTILILEKLTRPSSV